MTESQRRSIAESILAGLTRAMVHRTEVHLSDGDTVYKAVPQRIERESGCGLSYIVTLANGAIVYIKF